MASATTTLFILSAIPLAIGSYWLARRALARMQPGQAIGKLAIVCFSLLIFAMCTLFVLGSFSTLQRAYNLVTKPAYDAVVTGYTSEWHESQSTDSSGTRIGEKQLMYTAQLSFRDKNNQPVNIANSVQSNSIPAVGEHIRVVYTPGDEKAEEKSLRSGLLLGVSVLLLSLLGCALYGCIAYAQNQNMQQFMQNGGTLFAKVLVPVAIIILLLVLLCAAF